MKHLLQKTLIIGSMATMMVTSAFAADINPGEITVSGEASRQVAPTYATLNLGISSTNTSVSAAKNANDRIMSSLIANLKNIGIEKNNIQTSNISVNEDYNYNNGKRESQGYAVRNTVTIKITDMSKISRAIDAAVTSGANNINSLSFQTDVSQSLDDQLTTEAIQNARHQADVMARALGKTVGGIKTASIGTTNTESFDAAPRYNMLMAAKALSTSTPVEEGNMVANKTANITFYLQ